MSKFNDPLHTATTSSLQVSGGFSRIVGFSHVQIKIHTNFPIFCTCNRCGEICRLSVFVIFTHKNVWQISGKIKIATNRIRVGPICYLIFSENRVSVVFRRCQYTCLLSTSTFWEIKISFGNFNTSNWGLFLLSTGKPTEKSNFSRTRNVRLGQLILPPLTCKEQICIQHDLNVICN